MQKTGDLEAGIYEELVFRFLLMNVILIKHFKLSNTTSIIISSLIFGLSHYNLLRYGLSFSDVTENVIAAGIVGILFGIIYLKFNLTTAIFVHFIADLVSIIRCRPYMNYNIKLYDKIEFNEVINHFKKKYFKI